MKIEKEKYITDTKIISFAGSGNICFCDDYAFPLEVNGIVYPSVRHAVLSWKTEDIDIKNEIAKTLLPANLKDLEISITKPHKLWRINFIMSIFENYTFKKFRENPEFRSKLLATDNKELKNELLPGQADLSINEFRSIKNYDGIVLMVTRSYMRKLKAP